MTIEIDEVTLAALQKLQERYYFGLFKEISLSEEEEYWFRDAIDAVVKAAEQK